MGRRAVGWLVAVMLLVAGTIPGAAPAAADQAGITWTSRASAADNTWYAVAYGGGLFVAVATSGTGNRVMTSPDGITWTSQASAANVDWVSVAYEGGLFVAVGAPFGTGHRVMTSPDGITWTIRASAADNDWFAVTFGGGLFVAVAAFSGTGNRVMTSPDGITWTSRASAADNNWVSVAYGGGLFVAVAVSGTGNRVMTSPDGITWTSRTSAADNSWFAVAFGGGLFVAVAYSGSVPGNRVMTSGTFGTGGTGGSGGSAGVPAAPPAPAPQSLPPVAGVAPGSTVPSGGSIGSVNGLPMTTTIEANPAGGVQVSGAGSTVALAGLSSDGKPLPATRGGLFVTAGDGVSVQATGFLPQSQADVYMYSEQLWLGKATVDAGGNVAMSLTIPTWVTPGAHTLQFAGYQGPYTSIALSTGITIAAPAAAVIAVLSAFEETAIGYFRPGAVALTRAAKARLWNAVNNPAVRTARAVVSCTATHAQPRSPTERALWAQRDAGVTGFLARAGCDTVTARLGDLAGVTGATSMAIRVTATAS